MIETKITQMLKIRYPIIQGGLQGLGTSKLVAAVSNAGGLGLITAGSYDSKSEMLEDIERTRKKTDAPFGINIAIGIRKPMDSFIEGAIEAKVPVVFTSGNNPEPYVKALKKAGILVIHVAPSVKFAKKAESLGCDAVVVNGYECGGHPGKEDITSLTLIQKAVTELSIPVIAAGGFSTGKSLLAAIALGAEAIQMGTRFLMTKEVGLHESIKDHLKHAEEHDTIFVKKSIGKPARVLKTKNALKLAELEENNEPFEQIFPYISGESYRELIQSGNLDTGILSIGQTIGLINEVKSVNEVIEELIFEFQGSLKRVNTIADKAWDH